MNYPIEEQLIEEHRSDIKREITGIRRQQEALRGKTLRSGWFAYTMQGFGQWLIVRGEKLVKHYETPKKHCRQPASYAH